MDIYGNNRCLVCESQQHKNTLCGQNAEYVHVHVDGTHRHHRVLELEVISLASQNYRTFFSSGRKFILTHVPF
jgi:hypothetical protein